LMNIEVDFMLQSSCALWSICTVSTSSIGHWSASIAT
jgi:hypothetical protein